MYQTASDRHRHRFGAIGDAQFGEDVLEMNLDRLVGAADGARHFFIAGSARDESQHLELALGEVAAFRVLGQSGGNRRGNEAVAAMDGTNR